MPLSLSRPCERRLLAALRTGNAATYAKIVAFVYQPLVTYAVTLTKSAFDAEEIVQDILTRLWYGRKKLTIVGSFRSYLRQAVRNGVFDQHRRQQRKDRSDYQTDLSIAPPQAASALGYIITWEMEASVVMQLYTMPERWRSVFLLCAVEGYTQLETSHLLRLARSRVNLYLQYARNDIADNLYRRGFRIPSMLQTVEGIPTQQRPAHAYLPLRNPRIRVTMESCVDAYDPECPFSSICVHQEKLRVSRRLHHKHVSTSTGPHTDSNNNVS